MTYYNTTKEDGSSLDRYRTSAKKQDAAIRDHFAGNANVAMTPSVVWSQVFDRRVPLTSVRRAITTLTNQGVLRKLDEKGKGPYGRDEHYWIYNEQQDLFA